MLKKYLIHERKLDHQITLNNKMKTILNKDQFLVWQELKTK